MTKNILQESLNQKYGKNTCYNCWLENHQFVPATHFWNKGFSETWKWLCRPCYQSQQIKWIIWDEQKKQTIDKYLKESEKNTREFLLKKTPL